MKKQSLIRMCIVAAPAVIALACLLPDGPADDAAPAEPSAATVELPAKQHRLAHFPAPAGHDAHGDADHAHAEEHDHHHHAAHLSAKKIAKFVDMLDADEDFVRAQGVFGLANGRAVTPELGQQILAMIGETDDAALQKVGAWAVSRSGMPNAAEKLADLAVELPNPAVARRVVENLASMRSAKAQEAMVSVMAESTSATVRAKAAMVLGSTARGDQTILNALVDSAINDVDASVRSAALRALGSSSSLARRAALEKLSKTASSASVREEAALQLERAQMRLGDPTEVAMRFASPTKSNEPTDGAQLTHSH